MLEDLHLAVARTKYLGSNHIPVGGGGVKYLRGQMDFSPPPFEGKNFPIQDPLKKKWVHQSYPKSSLILTEIFASNFRLTNSTDPQNCI